MIHELRTYVAMPGRLQDLLSRQASVSTKFYEKYGIKSIGFWTFMIGGPTDQLVYILEYEDLADRDKKWSAFIADEERKALYEESEKNGPLVKTITAQIMRPTAYSPLK